MKILIVSQYFWPESFKVNDLAVQLKNKGHDVTVFTGMPNYPIGQFFKGYSVLTGPYLENYHGINVIRCPLIPRIGAKTKWRSIGLILNFISFAIIGTILAPFLVRDKYDKIFMYQVSPIFSALPAIVLRFLNKAPMIIWVTDLSPESLVATGTTKNKHILKLVTLFVKFTYRYSDLIYTSSLGFISRIKTLGVPEAKLKYWPQWAESLFSQQKKLDYTDEEMPQAGFIILFAGNIGISQDMPTIISAAEKIKNHRNIHFVILGDGLAKREAEQMVKEKNLHETVHLLGKKPMETMPYYYSRADVLLVSLTNADLFSITLPAKLQSYLASKKAVLASLNGEGAAIVEKWKCGFSCSASHPELLAETVLRFAKLEKTELEQMGINAYNCYLHEFEQEKLISILETDLENIKHPCGEVKC